VSPLPAQWQAPLHRQLLQKGAHGSWTGLYIFGQLLHLAFSFVAIITLFQQVLAMLFMDSSCSWTHQQYSLWMTL
jgi:hypothetical protein